MLCLNIIWTLICFAVMFFECFFPLFQLLPQSRIRYSYCFLFIIFHLSTIRFEWNFQLKIVNSVFLFLLAIFYYYFKFDVFRITDFNNNFVPQLIFFSFYLIFFVHVMAMVVLFLSHFYSVLNKSSGFSFVVK